MIDPDALLARVRELGIINYQDAELALIADTMNDLRPTHIFEWGTNAGESARIFYEATRDHDTEIHSIDKRAPGDECAEYPDLHQGFWVDDLPVTLHQGDGLAETLRLCDELGPERALVFVDDSHVLLDNARALLALRREQPSVVILVHDTLDGGPRKVIDWWARKFGAEYEIVEAGPMTRLWPR